MAAKKKEVEPKEGFFSKAKSVAKKISQGEPKSKYENHPKFQKFQKGEK